jgi:hypothetical protein
VRGALGTRHGDGGQGQAEPMWVAERSGEVGAQVVAIAVEVEAAQFGGSLAEEVAFMATFP